ncbi:MAG: T9SS type A sorting domain-containing protein [Flavobacterium sp.]|nr:T9SS type A sorting domain-containing protein [Flavobacterium sp.]
MITDTYLPITVNPALGLNQSQKDHFVYYPNPVNNVVNFENNNPILKITLFNLLGQRVEEKEINSLSGQLDMSKLPTGNYLLRIKTENGESTVKLVKN